ncbi:MAG TPA: MoaD/ThiS family protein [Syntrophomonas sp.]|jgi:molybdopterin synthase sulfur carrier subunit|nr:MoaD/ThiS family protein [Syntrophomonas sp.]
MLVKVKLFANFRKGRFREKDMELEEGCTVGQIVDQLKIPRKELGVVFLNGLATTLESVLQAGDTLSIFPMVGGG